MRVARVRAVRVEAALAREIAGAGRGWSRRAGVLLELRDHDGRVGQGEASPLPGYSPDGVDECLSALGALSGLLADLPEGEETDVALRRALAPVEGDLARLPSARFALETALLDLLGQRSGRSVAELLGATRPDGRVLRSGFLGPASGDLAAAAKALADRGIHTAKVKVGAPGAFDAELAALTALRASHGARALALRLDANGAWSPAEARERIRRLAPLDLAWIEEPTAGDGLIELGRTEVGWGADESLRRPDPERLLDTEGCAAAVIKPALLGGLLAARDLGRAAAARGLAVVVTHLFDGPIALAAACELALSFAVEPAASGLDLHPGLAAWPEIAVPQLARDPAAVRSSGRPGLGLERLSPGGPS